LFKSATGLNKTAVQLILFLTFQNGTGDANDVWKVVIVGGKEDEPLTTVSSNLKFIHYLQHCVLTSSGKQLPKW
jgi:dolichyl-phosphate-mannose-protein mannosyltransferase